MESKNFTFKHDQPFRTILEKQSKKYDIPMSEYLKTLVWIDAEFLRPDYLKKKIKI